MTQAAQLRANVGRYRGLLYVILAWVVFALVSATLRLTLGAPVHVGSLRVIVITVVGYLIWVPVTLALAWVMARWPLNAQRRYVGVIACIGILAIVIFVQPAWWNFVVAHLGGHPGPYLLIVLGQWDTNGLCVATTAALVWTWRSYQRSLQAELTALHLESALCDVEGQLLVLQLQPHFLFNALHAVSEIVYDDAGAAHQMLVDLRGLLAESFSGGAASEITVEEELRFLAQYVAIQRRRFRDRLTVHVTAERDVRSALVPHLLLQPLVENAIRHGIAPRAAGGVVTVLVTRDDATLHISVIDDGVGLEREADAVSHGFGVSHTKLRLSTLYGERAALTLKNRSPCGVETHITIPYHTEGRAAAAPNHDAGFERDDEAAPLFALPRGRWVQRGAVAVAWTVIALLWTQIDKLGDFFATDPGVPWTSLFTSHMIVAACGTALTLPAWRCAKLYSLRGNTLRSALLAQVALACATALANILLVDLTFRAIARVTGFAPAFASEYQMNGVAWGMWYALAYACAVAVANRLVFIEWHRSRKLEAARLMSRLAQTRTDLARLRLQPAVLLAALDEITVAAGRDPAVCDEMIVRLGDQLRAMLDMGVVDFAPIQPELRAAS